MAEQVFTDFSGGMNASVAVDKVAPNECLLAENVRFDEAGNVLISGGNTAQGTNTLTSGTDSSIHSLFFDASLGAIAGVGADVWAGKDLKSLTVLQTGINSMKSKMSFAPAFSRIYMDIGGVPYFQYFNGQLITVDWLPPSAQGATLTTKTVQTGATAGTGALWTNSGGVTGTGSFAQCTFGTLAQSQYLQGLNPGFAISTSSTIQGITVAFTYIANETCTFFASLILNGVPVGDTLSQVGISDGLSHTMTFGDSTTLWGLKPIPGDVNASNFGVQVWVTNAGAPGGGGGGGSSPTRPPGGPRPPDLL